MIKVILSQEEVTNLIRRYIWNKYHDQLRHTKDIEIVLRIGVDPITTPQLLASITIPTEESQ